MQKGLKFLIVIALVVFGILFIFNKILFKSRESYNQSLTRSTPYPTIPLEKIIVNMSSPSTGFTVKFRNVYKITSDASYSEPGVIEYYRITDSKDENIILGNIKVTELTYFDEFVKSLDLTSNTQHIQNITIGDNTIEIYYQFDQGYLIRSYGLMKNDNLSKSVIVTGENTEDWESFQNDFLTITQSVNFY